MPRICVVDAGLRSWGDAADRLADACCRHLAVYRSVHDREPDRELVFWDVHGSIPTPGPENPGSGGSTVWVATRCDGRPPPNATVVGERPAVRSESTRLNSSHITISYAVFCLKKKKQISCLKSLNYHFTTQTLTSQ